MATAPRRKRPRGQIVQLSSGSLQVRVFVGRDPVTKKRHYLQETVRRGPDANAEAEKVLRRLLVQVDEQLNPRTSATVRQLLEKHFLLLDVERTTKATYQNLARTHIVPLIGPVKLAALTSEVFDSFYAELRRCRLHCKRRRIIEHRVKTVHDCDHRCRQHVCKPLAQSTIRQIHVILSGALRRAVRWKWLSRSPIENAEPPKQPPANPSPPTSAEAARILNASWQDPDWAVLVWLTMVTGARRGELCALRWDDVDLVTGTLRVQRSIAELKTETWEKDTKTHQHRRIALDPESVTLLTAHRARSMELAAALGYELAHDAFVFSHSGDGAAHMHPRTITRRYARLVHRLGIRTTFHKLRHYSATELIAGGVDVRTVAGRLGHGGGGATTLRVYAAWVSEADQRASTGLLDRLPSRPVGDPGVVGPDEMVAQNPYELTAMDLRAQILDGTIAAGSALPTTAEVAKSYGIAIGTANRTLGLLREWGLIEPRRGVRAVIRALPQASEGPAEAEDVAVVPEGELTSEVLPVVGLETSVDEIPRAEVQPTAAPMIGTGLIELVLRRRGEDISKVVTAPVPMDPGALHRLLIDGINRSGGTAAEIGEYELEFRQFGSTASILTFVA
ncbi:site-specific tyrosine recombinase XerC [Pseudonocardia autotrophica]|nr:site-specific tyrosine recombinase XerC [Pseudonocardia autotrophica]